MKFKLLRRHFPELRWPAHSHHIILAILPLYGRKYAILILMAECFCLHFWLPQQLYTYILDSLSNDYQWSIQLWICNLIKKHSFLTEVEVKTVELPFFSTMVNEKFLYKLSLTILIRLFVKLSFTEPWIVNIMYEHEPKHSSFFLLDHRMAKFSKSTD